MMAKLIPERQIDWARIDRLATPKAREGDEPNTVRSGGATNGWSQSSGMLGYETMGSTLSSMAINTPIGDPNYFSYPFAPMTSPRSQKLAEGRRAQLERMTQASAERQAECRTRSSADEGATSSEGGAATPTQCGGASSSRGSTPSIRPQTSYGELLYRSSQVGLTAPDGVDTAESTGSVATSTWDARSPRANKGSITARATMAPQLARLPPFTPRMQRTCSVYGISPQYRVVRYTTGSGTTRALHEPKPVPPMPVRDDAF